VFKFEPAAFFVSEKVALGGSIVIGLVLIAGLGFIIYRKRKEALTAA